MAASMMVMNYGDAYEDDASLYGEHLRALDRFQTAPTLEDLLLPFERIIVEELRSKGCGLRSLVDLGCGTGRFLRAAEMSGVDAQGFEVAAVLSKRLLGHGRRVHRGGIDEFLASDLRPDAISLLEVVEHLPAPLDAITRLLQTKAPRTLFVVVPDWQTRRHFDARFAQHDEPPNHLTWWNERALSSLLGRAGYGVTVEPVPELRRSLLGHIARNRRKPAPATAIEWLGALVSPPPFWLLARAERR
jgi:SAM-dependent methyltransferase